MLFLDINVSTALILSTALNAEASIFLAIRSSPTDKKKKARLRTSSLHTPLVVLTPKPTLMSNGDCLFKKLASLNIYKHKKQVAFCF